MLLICAKRLLQSRDRNFTASCVSTKDSAIGITLPVVLHDFFGSSISVFTRANYGVEDEDKNKNKNKSLELVSTYRKILSVSIALSVLCQTQDKGHLQYRCILVLFLSPNSYSCILTERPEL